MASRRPRASAPTAAARSSASAARRPQLGIDYDPRIRGGRNGSGTAVSSAQRVRPVARGVSAPLEQRLDPARGGSGGQTPRREGMPGPVTRAFAARPNGPTGPLESESPLLELSSLLTLSTLEDSHLLARPVLALDVGGTHVRAAVVLDDGSRLALTKVRTPVPDGPEAILDACEAALVRARNAVPAEIR